MQSRMGNGIDEEYKFTMRFSSSLIALHLSRRPDFPDEFS